MSDSFEPSRVPPPAFKGPDGHLIWEPFVQLKILSGVPTRPTAQVVLLYNKDSGHVACDVREGPQTNPVARYGDAGLEFLQRSYAGGSYAGGMGAHTDTWSRAETLWTPDGSPMSDRQAICLKVLQNSDVYCPRQARSDFPKAEPSPFWDALLDDMLRLYMVASVLMD